MSSPPQSVSPARALVGGLLMGLANLVPGVSGGTMILALGLYDRFIGAVADLTSLRWSVRTFAFLGVVAVGLAIALLGFSGLMVSLVTGHRWIMYSLFIGMTLGGAPQLAQLSRPFGGAGSVALGVGFGTMVLLAFGLSGAGIPHTTLAFVLVGALAASSMILPGISGSYILLVLGMYDVVVGSLSSSELRADLAGSLGVIVPVGVGAALGIGLLSNVLKAVLARWSKPAHSLLLGLLLGSVLGLWPFQQPAEPELADKPFRKSVAMLVQGATPEEASERYGIELSDAEVQRVREQYAGLSAGELKMRGDRLERFPPAGRQLLTALALAVAGFFLTRALQLKETDEPAT